MTLMRHHMKILTIKLWFIVDTTLLFYYCTDLMVVRQSSANWHCCGQDEREQQSRLIGSVSGCTSH